MNGWMDEWIDGWMDGCMSESINISCYDGRIRVCYRRIMSGCLWRTLPSTRSLSPVHGVYQWFYEKLTMSSSNLLQPRQKRMHSDWQDTTDRWMYCASFLTQPGRWSCLLHVVCATFSTVARHAIFSHWRIQNLYIKSGMSALATSHVPGRQVTTIWRYTNVYIMITRVCGSLPIARGTAVDRYFCNGLVPETPLIYIFLALVTSLC